MVLGGDDGTGLLGGLDHQLLVQGLDGADVDDPGGDSRLSQRLSGLHSLRHHQSGGNDGHVTAVPQHLALADLKPEALLLVKYGHGQAAEAQVDGALVGIGGLDGGLGLHIVRGGHDHHAGNGPHQGKILAALVGSAVLPHGDAAVGGPDLHVQVGVADGVADLLKGPPGGEHGKAGGKHHHAHGGRAGGHRHHIALGNAAVEVPVGIGLLEHAGLGGAGQIGVKDDQVVMLRAQLLQGVPVALTGRDLFHIRHLTSPPLPPAER